MQLIVIGVWNGNFSDALKTVTPYHTELKIWTVGKRLCLEDETIDFFHSIAFGSDIKIPRRYEPDFNRTIHCVAPEESLVWSDLNLLGQDQAIDCRVESQNDT